MVHNMNCNPMLYGPYIIVYDPIKIELISCDHLNGEWFAEPCLAKMVTFERMMMSEYTFWLIWTTRRIL